MDWKTERRRKRDKQRALLSAFEVHFYLVCHCPLLCPLFAADKQTLTSQDHGIHFVLLLFILTKLILHSIFHFSPSRLLRPCHSHTHTAIYIDVISMFIVYIYNVDVCTTHMSMNKKS